QRLNAPELVPPKVGPQNDDGIATGPLVLAVTEASTHLRLHPEHAEIVAGDEHSPSSPRRGSRLGAEADGSQTSARDDPFVALGVVADVEILPVGEGVVGAVVRRADQ